MNLKIESVSVSALAATWDKVFGGWDKVPESLLNPASSHVVLPRRGQYTTLVRIRTTDGLEGVGESYGLPSPEIPAQVITRLLGPMLIGKDAMASEALWEMLFGTQKAAGRTRGFYMEAISGIDMALWDLRGKALGVPVHRLLGGPVRSEVLSYASPVPFLPTPADSADKAIQFVQAGFKAIKLKLGRGLKTDIAHAAAVREAVGQDIQIHVDLNCAYGVSTAISVGRELERLQIFWIEEPLETDDLDGLAEVRAKLSIPVVNGECLFSRYDFRDALLKRAVDVVMPNPARVGGITEMLKIAHLCQAFHVDISPHGVGSGINIAAALQVAASVPNFSIYEYNQLLNPLRHAIMTNTLDFNEGYLKVPDGPGLGVDLNEETVKQYAVMTEVVR